MLFSIIIAVYNKEKYIGQTIESILKQKYENYELILIDDGSTDSSYEICKEYANKNKKIRFLHHKNEGVSVTRNRGLQVAKGEYVLFVDADDLLKIGALKTLEEIIIKEKPDVIMFGMTERYEDQREKKLRPNFYGRYNQQEFFKDFHLRNQNGVYGYVANKAFRRNIVVDHEIEFCSKYKLSEDFYFFLQVYEQANSFIIIQKELYIYRKVVENALTNYKKINYMHVIEIYDFCQKVLKECGHEEESVYIYEIISHQIFYMVQDMMLDLKNADIKQIMQITENEELRNQIVICKDNILETICLILVKRKKIRILNILIYILKGIRKGIKRK